MNLSIFQTGDILLFSSKSLRASILQYIFNTEYYHFSLILKNPTFIKKKGIYILECTNRSKPPGVIINTLALIINECDKNEKIFIRHLNTKRTPSFIKKFNIICKSLIGSEYDIDMREYFVKCSKTIKKLKERRKVFNCVTIISYIYTKLGLLDKDTEWNSIRPEQLGSISNNQIKIINGELKDEIQIK